MIHLVCRGVSLSKIQYIQGLKGGRGERDYRDQNYTSAWAKWTKFSLFIDDSISNHEPLTDIHRNGGNPYDWSPKQEFSLKEYAFFLDKCDLLNQLIGFYPPPTLNDHDFFSGTGR